MHMGGQNVMAYIYMSLESLPCTEGALGRWLDYGCIIAGFTLGGVWWYQAHHWMCDLEGFISLLIHPLSLSFLTTMR